MRLYSYWRSTCSWRVRIALYYKQVPFEYAAVNLLGAHGGDQTLTSYRQLNPMAQVPTLELTQEDGIPEKLAPWRLTQSSAILEFLEERFPEPALLPSDPLERAFVRQVAQVVNSGIQPLQNLEVLRRIKDVYGQDERAFAQHYIRKGLAALEEMTSSRGGNYACGDQVTIADVFIVPQLTNARRLGLPLEPYPTLMRIEQACEQLPAFQAARPENQPDRRLT